MEIAVCILYTIYSIIAHELMHLIAVMLLEREKLEGFVIGICKYGVVAGIELSEKSRHVITYLAPQLLNLLFLMLPMWLAIPLLLANVAGGALDVFSVLRKGKEVRVDVYGVYITRDLKVAVGKF